MTANHLFVMRLDAEAAASWKTGIVNLFELAAKYSEGDLTVETRGGDAGGLTVLHDAVVLGVSLARADTRPAVLVLFTDGSDTGSWSSAATALDAVRHGHVVVFTVGAGLPGGLASPPGTDYMRHPTWLAPLPGETLRFMQAVADTSGGEFLRVNRGAPLAETFRAILARYRQRYLLTYTPVGSSGRGWHRLDVRLRHRAGAVIAREGYMAPQR